MRTRAKICGLTRHEDVQAAVAAGADALGFVFYEKSPRHVSLQLASELMAKVPGFVSNVALVVNATENYVRDILRSCDVTLLQFHGDESGEECRKYNVPYIKAIRVQPGLDWQQIQDEYVDAKLLLLDAYVPNVPGGTGETFDWQLIPKLTMPWALAGGLTPDNVVQAIQAVAPYAVDISGGVEAAIGVKDKNKMNVFLQQIKVADTND